MNLFENFKYILIESIASLHFNELYDISIGFLLNTFNSVSYEG